MKKVIQSYLEVFYLDWKAATTGHNLTVRRLLKSSYYVNDLLCHSLGAFHAPYEFVRKSLIIGLDCPIAIGLEKALE